ncbi:hypothetical protein LH464_21485 [Neorhizobium sp. T786]|uniref:hypothetical protein n=1 Tax=Pseudorhizobium xiangyangii TaxID=2883104 RepID=UPI001CFF7615|nr:hypothetical protein [Neorhizobium xiangyangii]MCB5205042.1 hypothetical protein [Neorhizobium xiangyangii]
MIDFEAMERRKVEWQLFAKTGFIPGIDPADLKIGMKVTISPNLMIHDRSYTGEIHEVVAVNTTHVQTRIPDYRDGQTRLVMLMVHEHHFYDATGFEA